MSATGLEVFDKTIQTTNIWLDEIMAGLSMESGSPDKHVAWHALRERGALAVDTRLDGRSSRRVIVTGFLINILNPKLSIFFLAFLPQFIAANEAHPLARMLELSGAFMAMTLAVFVLYGLFAASVRDRVISKPKVMSWLRRGFAGGFAALGAKLAFAER